MGFLEQQFVYFPDTVLTASPEDSGLSYEDVLFQAEDGVKLHGWYIPGREEMPAVLFCHGNAGNISGRVALLRVLHDLGLTVFIFDYRGYGKSSGRPSEEGTYADARGALAWLGERGWGPERIVYFGRSLGSGAAVQLALETPPAALVLEAPFTSLQDMGRIHYPVLYALVGFLLSARYDNLGKIPRVSVPLLIIQGDADRIVPESLARRLFAAANEPKEFRLIPGAGHSDAYVVDPTGYNEAWQGILSKIMRK